ncbi:tRNA (adenosine(37)-N6)-threonylcarbamoyltransferase complex ATPase subunit type 1 TsaE [Candidatus Roizmanbacteria bacterium RIFCSPHIGHO2_01_FULL_39_12b]|uniref:tRNA threonylcarbamoyladenosine biosynthesis protein TsaE n=1 Tax=Candidatus Roizmanbacteria bacterium RIFCSPHIGHO2_01_FULL_39_12b TaxID=1802030 RepID=A0A1F7GEC0_9BACT|nr:MAG: tRNA (adenosine(37)-N6)-threonylcarbamoyltransferase complex ATPase subunit type 1 TsaE [Candidatus Roizmanbacteria bacterium RIFCSPHIGHO2_01_FULL_39_12b]OGK47045.1 MAG: tRNA (adenosine(37)-N6)-threonylcarbamoyltransferase complex ATPase subunit type 1 TsaE [Candidatus Roizmanbacteria bacterium RIFCSPLOWO2_01_FULL_39_19]
MIRTYTTKSSRETKLLAKKIIKQLKPFVNDRPVAILLYGDLGAGKTVFVKGVGEELGINNISSPTFVLVHEYDLNSIIKKFLHIDLYRIEDKSEFKHLGILQNLNKNTLMCIEWSQNIDSIIDEIKEKAGIVKVEIKHMINDQRQITVAFDLK